MGVECGPELWALAIFRLLQHHIQSGGSIQQYTPTVSAPQILGVLLCCASWWARQGFHANLTGELSADQCVCHSQPHKAEWLLLAFQPDKICTIPPNLLALKCTFHFFQTIPDEVGKSLHLQQDNNKLVLLEIIVGGIQRFMSIFTAGALCVGCSSETVVSAWVCWNVFRSALKIYRWNMQGKGTKPDLTQLHLSEHNLALCTDQATCDESVSPHS